MDISDEKYISFTTFRKSGDPVASPVWVVPLDGESFGFFTSSASGKAKRLRHTSRVVVQPSDSRGRVKEGTEPIEATAEIVEGARRDEIAEKVEAKYGVMVPVVKVLGAIGGFVKRKKQPFADIGIVITPS